MLEFDAFSKLGSLQNVELEEMIGASMFCRVKREFVDKVEFALRLLLRVFSLNVFLNLHRKKMIPSIENGTSHYYNAHINRSDISHLASSL